MTDSRSISTLAAFIMGGACVFIGFVMWALIYLTDTIAEALRARW